MPREPFNLGLLEHLDLLSRTTGESYSRSASLTDRLGFNQVAVYHEILAPGRRASAPHFHSEKEELIIVLEGELVAHAGSRSAVLRKGDVLGFEPGVSDPHFLENQAARDAAYLVIASVSPNDSVTFSK